LFGEYLDVSLFKLGSSWASVGTYAGIDIEFKGTLIGPIGSGVETPWKYVYIRYNY